MKIFLFYRLMINPKFIFLLLILYISSPAFALNTCDTGFSVSHGVTKEINCHSECQKVTNSKSKTIFVPTKSSIEWSQFTANPPSNVSFEICITYSWRVVNSGTCSASPYWGSYGSCSGAYQYRTCYGTSGTQYRTVYCESSE